MGAPAEWGFHVGIEAEGSAGGDRWTPAMGISPPTGVTGTNPNPKPASKSSARLPPLMYGGGVSAAAPRHGRAVLSTNGGANGPGPGAAKAAVRQQQPRADVSPGREGESRPVPPSALAPGREGPRPAPPQGPPGAIASPRASTALGMPRAGAAGVSNVGQTNRPVSEMSGDLSGW